MYAVQFTVVYRMEKKKYERGSFRTAQTNGGEGEGINNMNINKETT